MKLILVLTLIALAIGINAETNPNPGLLHGHPTGETQLAPQMDLSKKDPQNISNSKASGDSGVDLKKMNDKLSKEMSKKATKAELKETYNQFLEMENSPDDKANMDAMMEKLAGIKPGSEDSMIDSKTLTNDTSLDVTSKKKDRQLDIKKPDAPDTYNNSVYNGSASAPKMENNSSNMGMVSPIFNQPNPGPMAMQQRPFYMQPSPRLNLMNGPGNAYPINRNLGMGSFSAPDIESGDPLMGSVGNEHIAGAMPPMDNFNDSMSGSGGSMKHNFEDSLTDSTGGLEAQYGANDDLDQGMHASQTQAMINSMDQTNRQKMDDMDRKMAMEDLANNAEPGGAPGSLKNHHKKQSIASMLKDYPPELVQQFMPELKRRVMRKVHSFNEQKQRNRKLKKIRNKIKREKRRERRRKLRLKKKHHHHHRPHHHHHHHHHHHSPHHNYQRRSQAIKFRPMTVRKNNKNSKTSALKILKNFVHKHSHYRHWARNLRDLPEMEVNDRNRITERKLVETNPIEEIVLEQSSKAISHPSPEITESQNATPLTTSSSQLNPTTPTLDTEELTHSNSPKLDGNLDSKNHITETQIHEASTLNQSHPEVRMDDQTGGPQTLNSQKVSQPIVSESGINDSDFLADMANIGNKDDELNKENMSDFIKNNITLSNTSSQTQKQSQVQSKPNLSTVQEGALETNQLDLPKDEESQDSKMQLSSNQTPEIFDDLSQTQSPKLETQSQDGVSERPEIETPSIDKPLSQNSQLAMPQLHSPKSDTGSGIIDLSPALNSQAELTEASPTLTDTHSPSQLEDFDEDEPDMQSKGQGHTDHQSEIVDPTSHIQNNLNELADISRPLNVDGQEVIISDQNTSPTQKIENLMGNMGGMTLSEGQSDKMQDFESGFQDDQTLRNSAQSESLQSPVMLAHDSNVQSQSTSIPVDTRYQPIQTDAHSPQDSNPSEQSLVPLTDQIRDSDEHTIITDESGHPLDQSHKVELLEELQNELHEKPLTTSTSKKEGKHGHKIQVDIKHLQHDQKVNMFHYLPPQIIFVNPYSANNGQPMQMGAQQPMVMSGQQMQTNGVQQPIIISPNGQMQGSQVQQPIIINQDMGNQMYNAQQPVYTAQQPMYNAQQPVYNAQQPVYNPQQPVSTPQVAQTAEQPVQHQPGPIINIHNNNHSHGSTHSSYEVGEDGQLHQVNVPDNSYNTGDMGQSVVSGNSMNPQQPDSNWGQVVFNPNITHHGMNTPHDHHHGAKHTPHASQNAHNAEMPSSVANHKRMPIVSPTMNDSNTLQNLKQENNIPDTLPKIEPVVPDQTSNLSVDPNQDGRSQEFTIDVDPAFVNKSQGQSLQDSELEHFDDEAEIESHPDLIKPNELREDDRKEYLTVPYETDNEMKVPEIKPSLQYQKTTREFHHYISPGETPDYQDLETNPKYGHKAMMNTIWEMTQGRPAKNLVEKNKDNGITEEWVDDRAILANQKAKGDSLNGQNQELLTDLEDNQDNGKSLNLNLELTNSDLANMPDGYSKDFSTDAANVHFTIDKSALQGFHTESGNTIGSKNCAKNTMGHKARRLTSSRILKGNRVNRETMMRDQRHQQDLSWDRAIKSFNSSEERIIDDDLQKYNPSNSRANKFAPSDLAVDFNKLSADPRKSSDMLLGGVGDEDQSLENFIRDQKMGYDNHNDADQMAAKQFEDQMRRHTKESFRLI